MYMKRLLVLGTLAALALSPTAEAKPHNEKNTARHAVTRQQVANTGTCTIARARTGAVVRRYSHGGLYYGGGYYGGGYYPYYSSGPSFSIGIGTGYYGYPGYGYGYGYPYGYGYNSYPYGYSSYRTGYVHNDNVVAQVQRRLASAGYYGGAIDGVAGPRTRSAIARWEARHGMVADGRIDRDLLRSLGV
jgi:hypothetical protein